MRSNIDHSVVRWCFKCQYHILINSTKYNVKKTYIHFSSVISPHLDHYFLSGSKFFDKHKKFH